MRHCGVIRPAYFEGIKKIPLNNVILPPLSPTLLEAGTELILVNKTKSNVSGEVLTLSRSQDGTPRFVERSSNETVRIAQLEQNIKFLQDQHQVMLNDLQTEVESLRNKNRDLQFQLIFNKTTPASPQTSPSSSSDDEHKIVTSPNQPNFTSSLHVELLEKSIDDLKIQLEGSELHNVYLSAIVDEQKKKLEKYERNRERERERAVQAEPELRRKVEESDAIIRRLQQEIGALRREGNSSVSPSHYHQRENYNPQRGDHREGHGHRENNGHQNGSYQKNGRGNRRNNSMNYRGGNWFPPLHSQNYWQGGGGGNRGGNQDKRHENGLPSMNTGQPHHERRGGNNNHHHHNGEGVRHRSSQNKGGDMS